MEGKGSPPVLNVVAKNHQERDFPHCVDERKSNQSYSRFYTLEKSRAQKFSRPYISLVEDNLFSLYLFRAKFKGLFIQDIYRWEPEQTWTAFEEERSH